MSAYTREKINQIETVVFDKINLFISEHGYPPTVRELQKVCGFRSSSTAHAYLIKLEDKGLISRSEGMPRAMKISGL